jgi:sugar lactone lactonase YvrE
MENRYFSTKKILIWFIVAFATIIFVVWLFTYLTTSNVSVKSDDAAASIQIKQILEEGSAKAKPYSSSAKQKLSVNLKKGSYEISVTDNGAAINQYIELKGRQKLSFTLNPPKMSAAEPVYGYGAAGLIADSSQLLFVDSAGSTLNKIDTQNNVTVLDKAHQLVNVKWANISTGIGLSKDNNLYAIQNGALRQIALPFSADANTVISYDITKDGAVYVGGHKAVYRGTPSGNFKQIYTAKTDNPTVIAGNNKVAIADSGQKEGTLAVVDSSGKTVKKDINAGDAAWSPNGNQLLVGGDFGHKIYDGNLNAVSDVLVSADSIKWQSDNKLMYGVANQLWSYDVSNSRSQTIAVMPSGLPGDGTIANVFPTPDNSYIYVTTQKIDLTNKSNQYQLYRVVLNNQPVPDYLKSLNIFLPETLDNACALNYVNFTKAAIIARFTQGTSAADCINKAKAEMQNYDLDPNNFVFNPQIVSLEGE